MRQAVVFTHVKQDMPGGAPTWHVAEIDTFQKKHIPMFKAFLQCPNIALVYVYVDTGFRALMGHMQEMHRQGALNSKAPLGFSIGELHYEDTTRSALKQAVDLATLQLAETLGPAFDRQQAPRFQIVGLPHLVTLIHFLYRANPQLVEFLAGRDGSLTYDSPKFVEAVIRLARGAHPICHQNPILRFDADVDVNPGSVQALLEQVHQQNLMGQMSFFSGGYGQTDPDPVNDFAVRIHWLADREAYNQARQRAPERLAATVDASGRTFLRDLGELGATQMASAEPMSPAMEEWLSTRRNGRSVNRPNPQVISGAGLYMSLKAITQLPPFTSFNTFAVWVDDHIKRRLHEVLGHLPPDSIERVDKARFRQDRHPAGLPAPKPGGNDEYFCRLFRGCLLHGLVVRPDGTMGPLAKAIHDVLPPNSFPVQPAVLHKKFLKAARESARDILEVWEKALYDRAGTLRTWASQFRDPARLDPLLAPLVEDAVAYVELTSQWNLYVGAINMLNPAQAHWLFRM